MGVSVPHKRESLITVTCHLFLVVLSSYMGLAGLVSSSVFPYMTSASSSVHRTVKWFCKDTSGFWGSIFLLLVLAIASFHSSVLLVLRNFDF